MHKTNLIACLLLLLTTIAQAQKTAYKQRAVGLSLGWQNFRMLDKHASPLAYGTNSIFPKVGFSYNRKTSRSDFQLELSGAIGQLLPTRFGQRNYKTRFNETDSFQYTISSPFYNANIKASYFRNISSLSGGDMKYWAGGVLNESAYYGDAVANFPWLVNAADLSPAFKVAYTPSNQHNLGIQFDFAAIGLVTRSIYALFPKSNRDKNTTAFFKQGTRTALPNKYRKVNMQLTYQYQVSREFAMGAAYAMKWMRYSQPGMLRAMDKNFDVRFLYTY
jgi:hypothetical protein